MTMPWEQLQSINQKLEKIIALLTPERLITPTWPAAKPYTVLELWLEDARDNEEFTGYEGDTITVATDGVLAGITIRFESEDNDAVPFDRFNPVTYPSGFSKFYLTNTAQAGKKVYLFIGRAAGASAQEELISTFEAATVTAEVSGQVVQISGQVVKVSGETVIAKVSGEAAAIYGYDYASGEWRAIFVDASGEIKIAVTVADIVRARISGDVVKVSGETVAVASGAFVQVSGQMVQAASGAFVLVSGQQVIAKVSGETVSVASGAFVQVSGQMVQVASGAFVQVSGQMVQVASGAFVLVSGQQVIAKVSGEAVVIGRYMPIAPTLSSGAVAIVRADAKGRLIAAVSGEVAKISGETVSVASGAFVQVSGQMVQAASGAFVQVSGQQVIAKVSGETVSVASGAFVQVSGQMVQVASGAFVLVSGQQVIAKVSGEVAKISGETVDIQTPTTVLTGAFLTPTADSGGTIVTSGGVKSATFKCLSGDVYIGGHAVGVRPYSGFGFLLSQGEATSFDIDNFGRVRICANVSGDWVTYYGVA